ncbi:MAG: class I SAM-dependent methyltransferase [Microthrixaceae bacterium]
MHDHGHEHSHEHGFDERAATWDDPAKVKRAGTIAEVIAEAVPLRRDMRLLEYGAGTGLTTLALRDRVGPATLADSSQGMRDVMATKIESGELTDARIWDLDLATQPVPDECFDLIVTVMTLHHIDDVPAVLRAFAELLDDDGYLCVADLEQEDGSFHGEGFVGHRGFDRSQLIDDLTAAGFEDVEMRECGDVERDSGTFPLFLASARRPTRSA